MTTQPTAVRPETDSAASTFAQETSPAFVPTFTQLARAPLLPEAILKRYGAYCAIDTRFRSAARLLQCLWLKDQGIPTAASVRNGNNSGSSFGSILSAEAAGAGRNFLSPAIYRLVLQELLMREEDAAIDEERLFGNALSSMPLTFNLFGPLALDHDLATAVFRRLLPDFVHTVEQVIFEHGPGRRKDRFLQDRTAFDLAVRVVTLDGEPATVFIEVKYSESMEGPAARMRDRYNEASRQVGLYHDPDSAILRSLAIEQLWREHLTASLAVDNGVTSRAIFMAIGPRLNRRVQAAFRVYEAELLDADRRDPDRVAFAPLTLETVIEAIAAAGASDLAQALWARYCDLDQVVRLAMQEIAGAEAPGQDAPSQVDAQAPSKPPLPRVRRRSRSSNRSRTNVASSTSKGDSKVATSQEAI